MGRPDVDHELNHDTNGEKMGYTIKQDVYAPMGMATSPLGTLEQQYLEQCLQTVWDRQITPFIVNANDRKTLDLSRAYTYWYITSLFKTGFCPIPPTIQTRNINNNKNASLNDNHFNLALLAEVAFAHSSADTHPSLEHDEERPGHKHRLKTFPPAAIDDNRCRRIRNNEACRKSRLRRKQLNAATKEKLVSLSQDNDELKRKIVLLEEEVRAAKNALLTKIESHSKEQLDQNLRMIMSNRGCVLDNSSQAQELKGKGSVEHMQ